MQIFICFRLIKLLWGIRLSFFILCFVCTLFSCFLYFLCWCNLFQEQDLSFSITLVLRRICMWHLLLLIYVRDLEIPLVVVFVPNYSPPPLNFSPILCLIHEVHLEQMFLISCTYVLTFRIIATSSELIFNDVKSLLCQTYITNKGNCIIYWYS